jgi:hypothetical protein
MLVTSQDLGSPATATGDHKELTADEFAVDMEVLLSFASPATDVPFLPITRPTAGGGREYVNNQLLINH